MVQTFAANGGLLERRRAARLRRACSIPEAAARLYGELAARLNLSTTATRKRRD